MGMLGSYRCFRLAEGISPSGSQGGRVGTTERWYGAGGSDRLRTLMTTLAGVRGVRTTAVFILLAVGVGWRCFGNRAGEFLPRLSPGRGHVIWRRTEGGLAFPRRGMRNA